jgi:hypothetical protein
MARHLSLDPDQGSHEPCEEKSEKDMVFFHEEFLKNLVLERLYQFFAVNAKF